MKQPDHTARRRQVVEQLEKVYASTAAYVTTDLNNLRYLTGFNGTTGCLVLTEQEDCLLLDGRYRLYGEELAGDGLDVELYEGSRWSALEERLTDRSVERLHVESDLISYGTFRALKGFDSSISRTYGDDWVAELRLAKDGTERQRLLEAVQRTEALFPVIEEWLEPGVTEQELSRWIRRELEDRSEGLAFDPLILSGPRTARPHSPASERALSEEDVLLVDMGLVVEGYHSDLTRMFFIGSSHPCEELYEESQRAAAHGFLELEPGVSTADVAAAAHDYLRDCGHGDHLRHGLGHGTGLAVHEGPRLSEKSDDVLKPGMVVTLEPGIYIDGTGGGRVEHNALVTEEGAELLDQPTTYFQEVVDAHG